MKKQSKKAETFEAGYQNCIKILEQVLIEVYDLNETPKLPVKEWDVELVMERIVNEFRAIGDIVRLPWEVQE